MYHVVETVQRGGVCAEVIAPAPHAAERLREVAAQIGVGIAEGLEVTGMLAVELFETTDERLLVNELAMRPHNSGHWTQDGAVTSQFEQHLRAVLDLPLGDPTATRRVVGHGQHPRRTGRGRPRRALRGGDGRPPRARRSTRTARRRAPAARSATSTSPATTSTMSRTRRGPRHPSSSTDVGRRADAIAVARRVVAGFFQPRALAWSGDPTAAFLRRAPGRRRHGLRLGLARHERRLAGPHRLRDPARGRGRLGAPHARQAHPLRPRGPRRGA